MIKNRVIVCGSRQGQNVDQFMGVMDHLMHQTYPSIIIAHGDGGRTDRMVEKYCNFYNVQTYKYPAQWDFHGRSAGPKRNHEMAFEFDPTFVLAFPGGIGTQSMIRIATKLYIPVLDLASLA